MRVTLFKCFGKTWSRIRIRKREKYKWGKFLYSQAGIDISQPDRENRIYLYFERPGNLMVKMLGIDQMPKAPKIEHGDFNDTYYCPRCKTGLICRNQDGWVGKVHKIGGAVLLLASGFHCIILLDR